MASTRTCLSQLTRTTLSRPNLYVPSVSTQQRGAAQSANAQKYKRKELPTSQRKKKSRTTFINHDLKDAIQFPLVDAMRYLRATEVGRVPTSSKYELHLRLKSLKNGPVVRNRIRLPHPVKTDLRIAVICDPNSAAATAAKKAGATLVGEEAIFDAVKEGRIEFDRCLCHQDSLAKMNKAAMGRILGPKGLMPSAKTGTVVKDVAASVQDMVGASEYRERLGVIRMAIGQLGMTPEELSRNIRSFIENVKKDMAGMSDRISKDIHEVVISSTNGPGLSLNGDLRGPDSISTKDLSTAIQGYSDLLTTSHDRLSTSSMDDLISQFATKRAQNRKRGGEDALESEAAGSYSGAKRIKTEDKEPSAAPTTPRAPDQRSQTTSTTPQAVASIDALLMTPKQKAFLGKKLDNASKAACGLPFWAKVNPQIASGDMQPTDLGTIGEKLEEDLYESVDHFMEDTEIMITTKLGTCVPNTDPQLQVEKFRAYFHTQMLKCPKRDTALAEPLPFHQSPAIEMPRSAPKLSPLVSSNATARPKRRFAPAAQDTTELKSCKHILDEFEKPGYDELTVYFRIPVSEDVPNYHSTVQHLMDISTIRSKLDRGEYEIASEFQDDFKLMFSNCFFFNPPDNEVHKVGRKFSEAFDNEWSKMATWINEHATEAPPPIDRRFLARRGGFDMHGARVVSMRGAKGRSSATRKNKSSESKTSRPSFAPSEEASEAVQPAQKSTTPDQQIAVSPEATTTPSLTLVQPARKSIAPEQQPLNPAEAISVPNIEAVQPSEPTSRQPTATTPVIEDPESQRARLEEEIAADQARLARKMTKLAAIQKRKALRDESATLKIEREPLDKEITSKGNAYTGIRGKITEMQEKLKKYDKKRNDLNQQGKQLVRTAQNIQVQIDLSRGRVAQIDSRQKIIIQELETLDLENIA
ncbi:ribosomal protein L1 [Aureobasidium subglaciale]|nr:ribosomal protein L1 [Aureobasidium subglaciale]